MEGEKEDERRRGKTGKEGEKEDKRRRGKTGKEGEKEEERRRGKKKRQIVCVTVVSLLTAHDAGVS